MNFGDISLQIPSSVSNFLSQHAALLWKGVLTVVVLIVIFVILKLLRSLIRRLTSGMVGRHYRKTVYRIFQIILSIVALFVILGIWGVSMTGLLAGAGFMGIVIGLAAQETLGNVISGILMMFSRPFEIGDWIELGDYSGIVEDISVINTRLETFDGEVVSVPNQMVSSSAINNISRRGKYRVKRSVGIDYEADPVKAREIAEEELENYDLIADDPAPRAMVEELGDSSVNLTLLFWIDDPTPRKRRQATNDIITSVKKRYEEAGIGIPFPHRELIQHEERGWKIGEG